MKPTILIRLHTWLEKYLPEQRLFLRSDEGTRFIRLSPGTQLTAMAGSAVIVGWAIIATAIVIMDNIGAGDLRAQAQAERAAFEQRLEALASERDANAAAASAAHERFSQALTEVSKMQSALLASEERRRELETGIDALQATLIRTMKERDAARGEMAALEATIASDANAAELARAQDLAATVDFLAGALTLTTSERDAVAADAAAAIELAQAMDYDRRLTQDRNDRIFEQLEDALTISVEPLDQMFRKAGLNTDSLLDSVRQGYSGVGGPLTMSVSTKGEAGVDDPDSLRAEAILTKLDKLNLYRLAAEKAPFAMPLNTSFRYTSPFGMRRHPVTGKYAMHDGMDMAGGYGSPVLATGDGVVKKADWSNGYGRLVVIQHDFGIETRYAHLSNIRVKPGQRVSRGDRIGDMGNSGRSTGTHLHYEVRVGGKPVNPMTYIKAARDVF